MPPEVTKEKDEGTEVSVEEKIGTAIKETLDPVVEKQKELDELTKEINKKLEKFDKIEQRIGVNPNVPEDLKWKYDLGMQLKAVMEGKKKAITTTEVAGITTETWYNRIFGIAPEVGAFLASNPRSVPIDEVVHLAKEGTRVAVYFQTEGQTVTESAPTIPGITANRETIMGLVGMSKQSLKYTPISLADYFSTQFRQKYAKTLDGQCINGTGSPWQGFVGLTGINSVQFEATKDAFTDLTWKHLVRAMHAISSNARVGSGWFISNSVEGLIYEMEDGSNRPIFSYDQQGRGRLYGHPVWITEEAPSIGDSAAETPFIWFGSTQVGCAWGVGDFEIALSEHSSFKAGNIDLRVMVDADFSHVLPTAYSEIKTGTTT